ncbi:hypothetical protein LMH87_001668 [Akanthomyces muscarius]|uniref:Kazal-like domain-containing protein n=1 Tax=Akanthomyces muscarius TaxID=2231603 RepID=A0A9W8Q823_AKAMU|nr:hypothetical protein LMH87_001668 [Akanthomyces muscarius]KAJ4147121.1 hypothetical protein LMH87_001668 [Akanthomyces muscarius]
MKFCAVTLFILLQGLAQAQPAPPSQCTFSCPAISDASTICAISVADLSVMRQFTANCSMIAYNCVNPENRFRFEHNGKCQDVMGSGS